MGEEYKPILLTSLVLAKSITNVNILLGSNCIVTLDNEGYR